MPLPTLGAYLELDDPLGTMWPDLVDAVYADDPRAANLDHLSPAAQVLFLVGVLRGEVVVGGLSTFFSNSSGNHVPETFDALTALGAEATQGWLREALAPFDGELPPRDRAARCEMLFAFEEAQPDFLDGLEGRFGEIELELNRTTDAFLQAHADDPLLTR